MTDLLLVSWHVLVIALCVLVLLCLAWLTFAAGVYLWHLGAELLERWNNRRSSGWGRWPDERR